MASLLLQVPQGPGPGSSRSNGSSNSSRRERHDTTHVKKHEVAMRGFGEKMKAASESDKKRDFYVKIASEAVTRDPLGIFPKDDRTNSFGFSDPAEKRKEASEAREAAVAARQSAASMDQKPGALRASPKKSKRKADDIFKSFGKEALFAKNAVQEVDGKLKINYNRLCNSETDMFRWRKALATNTRLEKLMFQVKERWQEDFPQQQQDLKHNHNALFRQRDSVKEDLRVNQHKKSVTDLKELQKTITAKHHHHHHHRQLNRNDTASSQAEVSRAAKNNVAEHMREPDRSFGEEQIISFIGTCLEHCNTLENAFRNIDANGSRAVCFGEFVDGCARMGWQGDNRFIFHALDTDRNGVVTMTEFLQLKPYMVKEMLRVLEQHDKAAQVDKRLVLPRQIEFWLQKARTELTNDAAGEKATDEDETRGEVESSSVSSSRSSSPSRGFGGKRLSVEERLYDVDEEYIEKPHTMSLYLFRNGDKFCHGKAVFCGKTPATLEELLKRCGDVVMPRVPPADKLLDINMRPVQSIEEVRKGGTYLLKGKEGVDPPPSFFIPRPALEKVRFKHLCEVQEAFHCAAESRPNTSASRPATSASQGLVSFGSVGSAFSEVSGGSGRVGGPPDLSSWTGHFAKMKKKHHLQHCVTWQVPDRLRKELTHGGKNQLVTHKRYDLWTVLPRSASDPALDFNSASVWSAASAPY